MWVATQITSKPQPGPSDVIYHRFWGSLFGLCVNIAAQHSTSTLNTGMLIKEDLQPSGQPVFCFKVVVVIAGGTVTGWLDYQQQIHIVIFFPTTALLELP